MAATKTLAIGKNSIFTIKRPDDSGKGPVYLYITNFAPGAEPVVHQVNLTTSALQSNGDWVLQLPICDSVGFEPVTTKLRKPTDPPSIHADSIVFSEGVITGLNPKGEKVRIAMNHLVSLASDPKNPGYVVLGVSMIEPVTEP